MSFFAYYRGPLRSVSLLTILGPPQVSFFAYYIEAPFRSVSSLTVWGPRKQLGTKRYLLDSDLSGPVVPTSSRHVITHGLTKGNSIGVEIGTV